MTQTNLPAKAAPAYLSTVEDVPQALSVLRENIGPGDSPNRFDFPRIKVPAGGAQHLVMPDGEPQKTVEGIIVLSHMSRAFWPQIDGDDTPKQGEMPQCFSNDAIRGIGDPGGRCEDCPNARPGSGKGKRQACKLMRNIYLLQQGQILPTVLQVPPASLKAARSYLFQLASYNKFAHTVETRLGAKTAKNSGGIAYSEITFSKVRDLEGKELEKAIQYAAAVRNMLSGDEGEEVDE